MSEGSQSSLLEGVSSTALNSAQLYSSNTRKGVVRFNSFRIKVSLKCCFLFFPLMLLTLTPRKQLQLSLKGDTHMKHTKHTHVSPYE